MSGAVAASVAVQLLNWAARQGPFEKVTQKKALLG